MATYKIYNIKLEGVKNARGRQMWTQKAFVENSPGDLIQQIERNRVLDFYEADSESEALHLFALDLERGGDEGVWHY